MKKHKLKSAKKCVHFFKCMWEDDCEELAKAELAELSPVALEAMGKARGIDLDRRKKKATLINELYEAM
tara:strand:- start:157 stop:363 length:207 start_codon:yes stop_codon:yes gene_type:complete